MPRSAMMYRNRIQKKYNVCSLPRLAVGQAFCLSVIRIHENFFQNFLTQMLPKCGIICYNERDFDNKEGCLS